MALYPTIYVNGIDLDDKLTRRIVWKQLEGIYEPSMLEQGSTIQTFDGPAKVRAVDMAYSPRKISITGRILNRKGVADKYMALEQLGAIFSGRPARIQIGSLYLEAEFGEVKIVSDSYKQLPGWLTYQVEAEGLPSTWYGAYGLSKGNAQGIVVSDDRVDNPSYKFASNSFTFTSPGDAPSEAAVSITGTVSTTVYLHGLGVRRVPVNLDGSGNGSIPSAAGFLVYPGDQTIRVENSDGTLASGIVAVNFYGTLFRYLGNYSSSYTLSGSVGMGNRFSEGMPFTLSRTGSAFYISTAGTLSPAGDGVARIGLPYVARRNLMAWSEDPSQSVYDKTWLTVTQGYADHPKGGKVSKLVEAVGTGIHRLQQTVTTVAGTLSGSWRLKAGERTWAWLVVGQPGNYVGLYVNLGTGTLGTKSLVGSVTAATESIVSDGDGWYTVKLENIQGAPAGSTLREFYMATADGAVAAVIGDVTKGVYYAGGNLEYGSTATPYQATNATGVDLSNPINGAGLVLEGAATNYLLYSEQFDNVWNTSGSVGTVVANATVSPDGTSTADKLVSAAVSNPQGRRQLITGLTASTVYRASFYVKAAEYTRCSSWSFAGGDTSSRIFDLSAKTASGSGNPKIEDVGGGWFRCSHDFTTVASQTTRTLHIGPQDSTSNQVFTGDGVSGVYIWGAQVETTPFATSYIPTTSTAVTRSADLCALTVPHNLLTYSQDLTQSIYTHSSPLAKTGGTDPSGGTTAASYSGNTANTGYTIDTTLAYTAGVTYCFAVWLKISTAGSTIAVRLAKTDGTTVSQVIVKPGTDWQRFFVTGSSSSGLVRLQILTYATNSSTWYATGNSLEQASMPGQYIPTTSQVITKPSNGIEFPAFRVQNGKMSFSFVTPPGSNVVSGTVILGKVGDIVITQYASTITLSRVSNGGTRSVTITLNAADGYLHTCTAEWGNYTSSGVRAMPLTLTVDSTTATIDVAALYGDLSWSTPERDWLSGGIAFSTISNYVQIPYQIPTNAIAA